MARRKRNSSAKAFSAIVAIIILLVAAWQTIPKLLKKYDAPPTPAHSNGFLVGEFLDVDQADCELFYLPDGKTALIDAGNLGDGEEIVSYLKSKNISKIDYLIATHPHADHIGGMSDVVDSFEIGKVFMPSALSSSKTYENFLLSMQNKSIEPTITKAGDLLFEGEDYKAECFSPSSTDYDDLNHYSLTVKITYGIHSFLLTGDAEAINEKEMLKSDYSLKSTVLKVGHHGSDTSSSKKFLKAVNPEYAVISCGTDNEYGHPHKEVLDSLSKLDGLKKLYRTDEDKTIIITADGKTEIGVKITTQNPTVVE